MASNLGALPPDLPVPQDDGGAAHLTGMAVPDLDLPATDGSTINLARLPGRHVIYIYPMTGRPDRALPVKGKRIFPSVVIQISPPG